MTIATELSRILDAKADIKAAIEAKGVTVAPELLLDGYAAKVAEITTGGGGGVAPLVELDWSTYVEITDFTYPPVTFVELEYL